MIRHRRSLDAFAKWNRPRCLLATLLLSVAVLTGPAAAGDPPKGAAPQSDEALVKAAGFADGDVGYLVVDLAGKRVLAERNPDRTFIPASVAKIATIAPALEILGADHRFTTTVEADGALADGVLTGSLVLRGGGDPSLTGDDLQSLAKQLADSGVKRVDGSFLYDASAMIELPQIDSMQPEAADYNAGISALSVNFNRVRVGWQTVGGIRSAVASAFSKKLMLPLDGISVAFAGDKLPGPYVRAGQASEDRWLLSASLPAKGEDWLPVFNPSRIAADVFRGATAKQGIALPAPTPGPTPEEARELARHDSASLAEIAHYVLRYSNNLSTELIGLAASHALTGGKLSLADSAEALVGWWRKRLPGVDWTGLRLGNHSGLSFESRATPRQIVTMLEEAAGQTGGADFHDLLHQIGWKGSKGSAHVKTGTMSYVRGLAGYIDTVAGHRLAFAIFFNDAGKREALNATFDPRVVAIDSRSRSWRNRAVRTEQALTKGWAERF